MSVVVLNAHVRCSGVLADNAAGLYPGSTIYSDLDPEQIESIPPTALHRNIDLAVVGADAAGKPPPSPRPFSLSHRACIYTLCRLPGVVHRPALDDLWHRARAALRRGHLEPDLDPGPCAHPSFACARALGHGGEGRERLAERQHRRQCVLSSAPLHTLYVQVLMLILTDCSLGAVRRPVGQHPEREAAGPRARRVLLRRGRRAHDVRYHEGGREGDGRARAREERGADDVHPGGDR